MKFVQGDTHFFYAHDLALKRIVIQDSNPNKMGMECTTVKDGIINDEFCLWLFSYIIINPCPLLTWEPSLRVRWVAVLLVGYPS